VVSLGKPVVLVLYSGSPLAVPWAHEHVPAIVQAWYPGEEGGSAVAGKNPLLTLCKLPLVVARHKSVLGKAILLGR
jgi:hypothetical protein